jgi:Cu(I)/Ag(I) efflux system membrane fusion protein
MWTGERSVVYVKVPNTDQPSFSLREVELGPALGNAYVIDDGLEAGEQVVINGTFTVDAAAQLAGKPSMMNPALPAGRPAAGAVMEEHDHSAIGTTADMESVELLDAQQSEVSEVLQDYIKLKDALVASENDKAAQHARNMEEKIEQVGMAAMSGAAHKRWMDILPKLKSSLKEINSKANIDAQRKAFVSLSKAIVDVAQSFGPFDEPVYVLYCPMADDDAGAQWLSASEEVLNPYYGDSMLRCGEVKEKIIDR